MRLIATTAALLVVATTVADAQNPGRGRGRQRAPGDSMRANPAGQRAARQAIERLIRTQVQASDDQMRKIQAIDARFEPQRVALVRDEMAVRTELRQAMMDTVNVDEARVGQLLDRMIAFPARRAAMVEAEQKELSTVLTPLQRAKYHAVQEQLRRRIEQGRGGPPPSKPPLNR